MDIDKPVTARQLAWILWGPIAALTLIGLLIFWGATVRSANKPISYEASQAQIEANTATLRKRLQEIDRISNSPAP